MGKLSITVTGGNLNIATNEISTDCSSVFQYAIGADPGDSIDISLSGDHSNEEYVLNGITTSFTDSVTGITFDTSLQLNFVLENSGFAGSFESTVVTITNTTTSSTYSNTATRYNDETKCAGGGSSIFGSVVLGPYIYNPDAAGVTGNTDDFTLAQSDDVFLVTVNGQVIDDSEWSQSGTTLTVTPDNGFSAITDEVLVYQNRISFSTVGNVEAIKTITQASNTQVSGDSTVLYDGAGDGTYTLLTSVGRDGEILKLKNISSNVFTIDPDGSETIDGYSDVQLYNEDAIQIQSDGANWIII